MCLSQGSSKELQLMDLLVLVLVLVRDAQEARSAWDFARKYISSPSCTYRAHASAAFSHRHKHTLTHTTAGTLPYTRVHTHMLTPKRTRAHAHARTQTRTRMHTLLA